MLLLSRAEFVFDVLLTVAGGVAGWVHGSRLIRRVPDLSLQTAHRHARPGVLVVAAVMAPVAVLSLCGMSVQLAWKFPLWLEVALPFLDWGGIGASLAYLASLSLRVVHHERHRERSKLTFATTLIIAAILIFRWWGTWPIADTLYEMTDSDSVVLQSSGSSCAAASAANILSAFGIRETEEALAREMGTTVMGTGRARVALAMWRRGLHCRSVHVASFTEIKPPAALIVDHPATGPETHMVALMAIVGDKAEVWDPLKGKVLMSDAELNAVWHGRGLEVYRAE
jgi:hypothetical protein